MGQSSADLNTTGTKKFSVTKRLRTDFDQLIQMLHFQTIDDIAGQSSADLHTSSTKKSFFSTRTVNTRKVVPYEFLVTITYNIHNI